MNDRELLALPIGNDELRRILWRRLRGKELKGKVRDRLAKLAPLGSVPRIDRVEVVESRAARPVDDAKQIEACVGDGSRLIGKKKKRKNGARSPDLGVIGARGFERRKREDHVADRAGTNQQTPHYRSPYSLRAFSRNTIFASSMARSLEISSSRNIPVRAIPNASRPVFWPI